MLEMFWPSSQFIMKIETKNLFVATYRIENYSILVLCYRTNFSLIQFNYKYILIKHWDISTIPNRTVLSIVSESTAYILFTLPYFGETLKGRDNTFCFSVEWPICIYIFEWKEKKFKEGHKIRIKCR